MDGRVHRVGANGAFKKVMDTGSGGATVMKLGDWRKLMMGMLILFHHSHRWHSAALNATRFHSLSLLICGHSNHMYVTCDASASASADGWLCCVCVCFKTREEKKRGRRRRKKIVACKNWCFSSFPLLGLLPRQQRSDSRYWCPNPDDPLIKIKRLSGFSNENQEERRRRQ